MPWSEEDGRLLNTIEVPTSDVDARKQIANLERLKGVLEADRVNIDSRYATAEAQAPSHARKARLIGLRLERDTNTINLAKVDRLLLLARR